MYVSGLHAFMRACVRYVYESVLHACMRVFVRVLHACMCTCEYCMHAGRRCGRVCAHVSCVCIHHSGSCVHATKSLAQHIITRQSLSDVVRVHGLPTRGLTTSKPHQPLIYYHFCLSYTRWRVGPMIMCVGERGPFDLSIVCVINKLRSCMVSH